MVPPPHTHHELYLTSPSRADVVSESVGPFLSSRSYAADAGFEHLAIYRPADLEVLRVQSSIICRKQMEVVGCCHHTSYQVVQYIGHYHVVRSTVSLESVE
jgi:hypothetical protein